MQTVEQEYAGHVIALDGAYRFAVRGPYFEGEFQRAFDSMKEAKEEIDKRVMLHAKSAEEKLGYEVLKQDGSGTVVIKGLHARLGTLLFTDGSFSKRAAESYSGINAVYPNVEWIRALLISRESARKELAEMDKALKPYAISIAQTYGTFRSPEQFVEAVEKLKLDYAKKIDAARKADMAKVLA